MPMVLAELIAELEKAPQDLVVSHGFGEPHSYRGYYEDVAFRPKQDVTVAEMLAHAKSALGKTFHGYKGGEYTMTSWSDCWIAEYGNTGDALSHLLLKYMLGEVQTWR